MPLTLWILSRFTKKFLKNDEKGWCQRGSLSFTAFRAVLVLARGCGCGRVHGRERYVAAWQDEDQSR